MAVFLAVAARADEVTDWHEHLLTALVTAGSNPLVSGRDAALLSAAVIAISTLVAFRELQQSREQSNDFTNEFAIADTAIQDEFSQ
jgi:hypothetical protein